MANKKKIDFSAIPPQVNALTAQCAQNSGIDPSLFTEYQVNRGLRDMNGNGVLTGLTEISEIKAKEKINGESVPCKGQLFYRGYNVEDLVKGFQKDGRFGFEETVYLLLFGALPNQTELTEFKKLLVHYRSLPNSFIRDIIMKAPSTDMMNTLARSVLTLYAYDNNPDSTELNNVVRQCLQLISLFPELAVYGYQAYEYYHNDSTSFFIHDPRPELSVAENILYMLRADGKYSALEAHVLDLALVLHAEHGGGNNSTFSDRVITSSGTDTYSAIAGALGSLKGPKHGGANIKVVRMFESIKENVRDWTDHDEVAAYLQKILNKEVFDHAGLIYGMGHAVYSLSDPRAEVFKNFVSYLAEEKHMEKEFALYESVEQLAPQVISNNRKMFKGVSANIDFYSGFVYQMIGIPTELFTPVFAMSRIAGWSAHRIEELVNASKIIRPAYKSVAVRREYQPLEER